MTFTHAQWFDGYDGKPRDVQLSVEGDLLVLHTFDRRGDDNGDLNPDADERSYELRSVRGLEVLEGLPSVVDLPDGGSLRLAQVMPEIAPAAAPVSRIIGNWWSVLACAAILIATVVWLDRVAISWAADIVVSLIPERWDRKLGDSVLDAGDASWLKPSQLTIEQREEMDARFRAATEGMNLTLEFRRQGGSKDGGFNAFALPGKTIVLLDGMASQLKGDEVMWVLGHEVGHVVHRHGMHAFARSFGIAALASSLWGDFSSWAVAYGASLPEATHARDDEREADDYMRDFGRRNRLDPEAQVRLWTKVDDYEEEYGGGVIPSWLSTHPPTKERLEAAKQPGARTPQSGDSQPPASRETEPKR